MSVRRLAERQPDSFAFNEANAAWAQRFIGNFPEGREQSAVIPLMMRAQEQEGWVTKPAIEYIADMLHMPYIRALEVATFYTQFQLKPVGTRAHVQVCGTTPCMLRGSEALMDVCRTKINPAQFHTNADGTLSWEEVECLGACVNAPMVMIFKDTYEDLTPERLGEIIEAFEAGNGASVKRGPQVDRLYSAPQSGLTTLTDEKAILRGVREREAQEAAEGIGGGIPPSRAGKPKTDAVETAPAVKSPSPEKSSTKAEGGNSAAPPSHAASPANETVDDARQPGRQRKGRPSTAAEPEDSYKSPELLKGEPIGADAKVTDVPLFTPDGGGKPPLSSPDRPLAMPRPAKPDDLKMISGVGPKIERILNELGIHTFAQIASWQERQCDWVDAYLSFRGRISRDDWVKQAKALAEGGEAEYVRVFGRKPR